MESFRETINDKRFGNFFTVRKHSLIRAGDESRENETMYSNKTTRRQEAMKNYQSERILFKNA